jgi:hypothetical protein
MYQKVQTSTCQKPTRDDGIHQEPKCIFLRGSLVSTLSFFGDSLAAATATFLIDWLLSLLAMG